MDDILKGIVSGILSSYVLIYGLRPSVTYPEYILDTFENKWIFILLIICNYYLFIWDYACGSLLLLSIVSLGMDYIIFAEKSNNDVEDSTKNLLHDVSTVLFPK